MKNKMKLSNLLNVLPPETGAALAACAPDTGQGIVYRKAIAMPAAQLIEGERAAIGYASTRGLDRDHEIMVPEGAILDPFRLNPVVMWAHNYAEPPTGKITAMDIDDQGLKVKRVYADTARGNEVWNLIKADVLRAMSIGFIPTEWVEADGAGWDVTVQQLCKQWGVDPEAFAECERIYTKWVLLEVSDVPVPSNPMALTESVAKGLSPDMRKAIGQKEQPEEKPAVSEQSKTLSIIKLGRVTGQRIAPLNIRAIVREQIERAKGRV